MFQRFTATARAAVVAAQDEARRLGRDYIGTEHLLLGILAGGDAAGTRLLYGWQVTRESVLAALDGSEGGSIDADALAVLGIDLDEVRRRVEDAFGRGALAPRGRCRHPRVRGAIPFTPRAKKALELALRESLALRHEHIGDEHVLLGLLGVEDGLAAHVLAGHGLRLDLARSVVAGRPAA